jgi:hypothetical protein
MSTTIARSSTQRRALDPTPRRFLGVTLSQKAMEYAPGIGEQAHDLVAPIDPDGFRSCGARGIDCDETIIVHHIAVSYVSSIDERAYDLALLTDPVACGKRSRRDIEGDEAAALVLHKSMAPEADITTAFAVAFPMFGATGFFGVKGRRCGAQESENACA